MASPASPSTNWQRDLLYTHGNIARAFGAQDAAEYFTRLLRIDEHFCHLSFAHNGPETFFVTWPTVPSAHPSVLIANRPAWLLDYLVRNYGTVVPQGIWSPANPADAQRYNNVPLNMPIFFVHNDRRSLGLPVTSANAGNCMGLLNAHATAPVGECHTTYIRIKWPGYPEWSTQIMTRDQTSLHRTITLEKLAKRVASAVCKFVESYAHLQCQFPDWRVGGPGGIRSDDIILIGFIHVSQGSWQPILQINRYIMSGFPNV
ncbi:hypothetical protein F5148DRAFT_1281043 [Russula earlei]|uniref:Uncharacterized protein n=1 Tax=Russula earlei TaxID=71964 RepID=A0ACC0UI60_9AGAM|nr:hypothetical protein F5148DRAFT_1281043 [Russula earlei]